MNYPTQPGYGYYPPPQPPQPPRRRGMSTPMLILTIVGSAVAALCIFGAAIAAFAPPPDSKPAAEETTTTVPTQLDATAPAATPTSAAPPTSAPPAGPKTSFGDGTYEIGIDIVAGKYRTTVPSSSWGCYWERLKGLSGQFSDIIANDNVDPGTPAIVTISASDKGFTSRGCGTWAKA